MSYLIAGTIGLMVAIAVLQLLQRDAVRIVIGLYLLWNATNLLIIGAAGVWGARAPLHDGRAGTMADPLVQAFVLTAIVITFGFTGLLAAVSSWLAKRGDSLDVLDFQEDHDLE
jgi:multicomponent Na+:H+ antiporter subunit C